jgi:hypothetical protein
MTMLRKATTADVPRLLVLGEAMHDESPLFRAMAFDAGRLRATLEHVISSPAGFAYVYELGDEVVGGMIGAIYPHWASPDLVACDMAVFIEPAHRGGMGFLKLLSAYKAWAHDMGAAPGMTWLGLTTGVDTDKTASVCERLGWSRVGVVMGC